MKTGSVGNTPNQYAQYQNVAKTGKAQGKQKEDALLNPVDKWTPAGLDMNRPPVVGAADQATIDKLWKDTNHVADAVRKLVASAIGKNDATGQGFWAVRAGGAFQLSEAERAQAQELIGEDGFFGVKQTTARIMDFAKALVGAGASDEQIEKMRAAVQKGFDEVARMFGGFDKLPEVSQKTHAAIMKAFDDWLGISGDKDEDIEVA